MTVIMLIALLSLEYAVYAEDYKEYRVTASVLHVRSFDSLSAPIIGFLFKGDVVEAENSDSKWAKIKYKDGQAYVSRYYLKDNTNEEIEEEMEYIGTYRITGYDICRRCCGKTDGITASGKVAKVGRTVAMKGYPFGTKLYIEGIGYRIVEDRGGFALNTIDVLCSNHSECYTITGNRKVYIVN